MHLVFGAGFVLGPIRILFLLPRFGVRLAELMEFPVMLVVIVLAARWLVRKFQLAAHALLVGLLALGLMIAFELTLVLWLSADGLRYCFHFNSQGERRGRARTQ